jgi:hypothetical protein
MQLKLPAAGSGSRVRCRRADRHRCDHLRSSGGPPRAFPGSQRARLSSVRGGTATANSRARPTCSAFAWRCANEPPTATWRSSATSSRSTTPTAVASRVIGGRQLTAAAALRHRVPAGSHADHGPVTGFNVAALQHRSLELRATVQYRDQAHHSLHGRSGTVLQDYPNLPGMMRLCYPPPQLGPAA